MKGFLYFLLSICILPAFSQKSLLNDLKTYEIIKSGLNKSYNYEFEEAYKIYEEVKVKYPEHPAYPFLMAGNLFWEMAYYDSYKEKTDEYFAYLQQSLNLASKFLEKNPKDPEGVFFTMATESALALYYAERDDDMKCLNHAKKAYSYMKDGFALKSKFVDFYFSTGLYDYYVVQYPETHPVFKPFMFFFAKGEKQRGIEELDYAVKHGIFTQTECALYLANIYLKYENIPEKALPYSESLVKKFPKNYYFISRHIESLLATKQFHEAEVYSYTLYKTEKKPYIMRSYVYYGMLNEQYHNNPDDAIRFYNAAIKLAGELSQPVGDFYSFAYAGLARIYFKKGDKNRAVDFYKKALKYAEYEWVKKEAREFLEKNG